MGGFQRPMRVFSGPLALAIGLRSVLSACHQPSPCTGSFFRLHSGHATMSRPEGRLGNQAPGRTECLSQGAPEGQPMALLGREMHPRKSVGRPKGHDYVASDRRHAEGAELSMRSHWHPLLEITQAPGMRVMGQSQPRSHPPWRPLCGRQRSYRPALHQHLQGQHG